MRDDESSRAGDLHHLVGALRRLIALAVTADAPADSIARASGHVIDAVATLAPFAPGGRCSRTPGVGTSAHRAGAAAGSSDPAATMPFDPVLGPLSPLALPLRVRWEPPKAIGEAAYTAPYEGPPGCVHGGIIAAAFDQVFNVANLMAGTPSPTASLRLDFRRPTPLGTALRFEGWQERVEGRRVHVRGRLLAGDRVTVEAEGVFVVIPVERILQMLGPDDDDERKA